MLKKVFNFFSKNLLFLNFHSGNLKIKDHLYELN